jgi:hypothetical protein
MSSNSLQNSYNEIFYEELSFLDDYYTRQISNNTPFKPYINTFDLLEERNVEIQYKCSTVDYIQTDVTKKLAKEVKRYFERIIKTFEECKLNSGICLMNIGDKSLYNIPETLLKLKYPEEAKLSINSHYTNTNINSFTVEHFEINFYNFFANISFRDDFLGLSAGSSKSFASSPETIIRLAFFPTFSIIPSENEPMSEINR